MVNAAHRRARGQFARTSTGRGASSGDAGERSPVSIRSKRPRKRRGGEASSGSGTRTRDLRLMKLRSNRLELSRRVAPSSRRPKSAGRGRKHKSATDQAALGPSDAAALRESPCDLSGEVFLARRDPPLVAERNGEGGDAVAVELSAGGWIDARPWRARAGTTRRWHVEVASGIAGQRSRAVPIITIELPMRRGRASRSRRAAWQTRAPPRRRRSWRSRACGARRDEMATV